MKHEDLWSSPEKSYFARPFQYFLLAVLFIGAFYVRAYHIQDPPLGFAPNVQYRSAMISRSLFFQSNPKIENWRKNIAALQKEPLGLMEPPLMEYIAFLAYKFSGKEILWFPRLLASIFWLIGGLFLFLIVSRLFSQDAALISTAYFLFIPFGIFASRSFQPDPLMIMGTLIGLYFIIKYYENQTKTKLYMTAGLLSLIILTKFVNAFALLGAFAFLGISKKGIRSFTSDIHNYFFGMITLLPSFIYYSYTVLVSKTLSADYFYPNMFFHSKFWMSWYELAGRVAGFAPLFLAVLTLFIIKNRSTKSLVFGLWTGYFFYALIFTYSTFTHAYYHLQLIPIVAITLGGLSYLFFMQLGQSAKTIFSRLGIVLILFFAIFLIVRQARWKLNNEDFRNKAAMAEEIGRIVNHSSRTIFLSDHYGGWLRYHGELTGWFWPTHWDFEAEKIAGLQNITARERFEKIYKTFKNDFFIVTFLKEFDRQENLKKMLFSRFPVLRRNEKYIIFDLRPASDASFSRLVNN